MYYNEHFKNLNLLFTIVAYVKHVFVVTRNFNVRNDKNSQFLWSDS